MKGYDGRRDRGRRGEEIAGEFLRRKGYRKIAENYRCRMGEIDLVVMDEDTLVFVEVKSRKGMSRGRAEDKITASKRRRLVLLARFFLLERGWLSRPARFDVVTVEWEGEGRRAVTHYRDAFWAPSPW